MYIRSALYTLLVKLHIILSSVQVRRISTEKVVCVCELVSVYGGGTAVHSGPGGRATMGLLLAGRARVQVPSQGGEGEESVREGGRV